MTAARAHSCVEVCVCLRACVRTRARARVCMCAYLAEVPDPLLRHRPNRAARRPVTYGHHQRRPPAAPPPRRGEQIAALARRLAVILLLLLRSGGGVGGGPLGGAAVGVRSYAAQERCGPHRRRVLPIPLG